MADNVKVGIAGTPLSAQAELIKAGWKCNNDGMWSDGHTDAMPFPDALAVVRYYPSAVAPVGSERRGWLAQWASSFNGTYVMIFAGAALLEVLRDPPDFLSSPKLISAIKWGASVIAAGLTAVQIKKQVAP